MQLNEINFENVLPIEGYGSSFFRVGGKIYNTPILVYGTSIEVWSGIGDLQPLIELVNRIDVIFIGVGLKNTSVPNETRSKLALSGLRWELMDTPAACRSYNVLLAEARNVALAVVPV